MSVSPPKADEYLSDQMNSPHLSPRLVVEKPILPSFTVRLDDEGARLQRWYDVAPETLNKVGVRSVDFVPDGVARLTDKDGNEIYRATVKLTDEFDGLPLLLAHIEKLWSQAPSAEGFWVNLCSLMVRSQIPSFREVAPGIHNVVRTFWLECSCVWMAFLWRLKSGSGCQGWDQPPSGQQAILKFVDFYNKFPSAGPHLTQPKYDVDRAHLHALLDAVHRAVTNDQKKRGLEGLAESLLKGVPDFEVFPNKWTATGELDQWLRKNSQYPQLRMLGPKLLVECKQWQKTVGTDSVGALIADLKDAGLTSGLLFTQKDISKPARRRLENFYQQEKGYVLVITEREIQAVCDGANLVAILVEKVESIIFPRLQGSARARKA